MTEKNRKQSELKSEADLSRARQRKMKREGKSGPQTLTNSESAGVRSSRSRASRRSGTSMREMLVGTHIKSPTPSMQNVQGKLSSRLGRIARQISQVDSAADSQRKNQTIGTRNTHRKSEPRRSDTNYTSSPRSETQRKSSTDHSSLPRKNRRIYDARSEASPPVMVRGGLGGMAFGRVASSRVQKQKAPRRRYDVPLSIQGAEVRLPSVPLVHLGWRAISLLMVLLLVTILILMWKAPVFQVRSVEAAGLKRLTANDLNAVMTTYGSSVFTLDPHALEKSLEQAFPEFSSVSVRVNMPANVKVEVVERVPIIDWSQDGDEVWLDAEGISFPPRGEVETPLVLVEGHGTPPGVDSSQAPTVADILPPGMPGAINPVAPRIKLGTDLIASILSLGAKMPADTLLVYDSEHGLGWNDPNGWEVYFGREDQDMEMKLLVYQALVEHLQSEGIQPALISVEFVHAPYYRMER